jgi:hypothetical protein
VQAPMPVRHNSVRAGPHRPFCGGEGNDQSIVHAVYSPQSSKWRRVCKRACQREVEQAGAPAAKMQRTAGGASVGCAGGAGSCSVAGSAIRAPAIFMQLVKELRSGTAAMRADAALEMANMAEQSKHNRAGITWADAIG